MFIILAFEAICFLELGAVAALACRAFSRAGIRPVDGLVGSVALGELRRASWMVAETESQRTWRSVGFRISKIPCQARKTHLVGELGPRIGEGDGVRASGDNGMTQTDFLRLDDGDLPEPIE